MGPSELSRVETQIKVSELAGLSELTALELAAVGGGCGDVLVI
jgi:hypothetical protein